MKICFLGDAQSIHIKRWCEFFRDKGDDVTIVTFRDNYIKNINVINLGKDIKVNSNGGNFSYLKKTEHIRNIIKDLKPDIVNSHYLTSYGLLGALTKQTPLVVSTWGTDILVTPKKNIIYKEITKYVLKKCEIVTSDSNYMSKEIEKLGKAKEQIITVPMGIDDKFFNNINRKKYNKTILSLRTLCSNSNIDVIIKAFYKLTLVDSEFKLIIANDGAEKQRYIDLIKELKLENKIDILGSVDKSKVVELLKSSTLYISIPTSDSTSVTLLEAMACGTIPIVSNIPANLEWIINGYNGYVINEINENSLYECIINAFNNFNNFNNFAIINNDIIYKKALWEKNMNFIRNAYLKLI